MRWFLLLALVMLLGNCEYTESVKETGHKGRARINPYLAAERFLEQSGFEIESRPGWPTLDDELGMVVVPVSVLSAEGYIRSLENWVEGGGHAVILLAGGESHLNDWSEGSLFFEEGKVPDPAKEWLRSAGFELRQGGEVAEETGAEKDTAESLRLDGERLEVFMEAELKVAASGEETEMISSLREHGGRITVVADARPFRNRYIGDYDHARMLLLLAEMSPTGGAVTFVRNASLSLWTLLWEKGWPAMIGLILLVLFWLWKSLPRFGPLDSHEKVSELRSYDHHLEALGDFHWRLDRAEGLLRPLREGLLERAHRLALSSGHRNADVFDLMAERAGLTRERTERAMTHAKARDAGSFTRLIADLQTIHLSMP